MNAGGEGIISQDEEEGNRKFTAKHAKSAKVGRGETPVRTSSLTFALLAAFAVNSRSFCGRQA